MKTILALAVVVLTLQACDQDEPMPAPQAPTQPVYVEPPAPPPYDFPIEENAMKSLRAPEALNSDISYVITVGKPRDAFEILGGPEPEDSEFSPRHAPELLDLHPKRLEAMGLDPDKAVGIAILGKLKQPTESSNWAVFGSIGDEGTFRTAFSLGERDPKGFYPASNGDRRAFVVFDNDEVVIASRPEALVTDAGSLAQDEMFVKLVNALDYGALVTGYLAIKRGKAAYGVGLDEVGLGVKVFADSELQAGTVRLKFAELPASMFPELPYLDRAVDMAAELEPTGRQLRGEIDEIAGKPRHRRTRAAHEMLSDVEDAGELNTIVNNIAVAGRVWKVTKADVVAAYEAWQDLGPTREEAAKIADLEEAITKIEKVADIDQEALGKEVGEGMKGMVEDMNGTGMGGVTNMVGKFGGLLGGGGGGKGGKKGGPGGMLGGLGGMFGGGGGGEKADIVVTSSNSALRDHVRRQVQALALCWSKHGTESNVTVVANVEVAQETGNLKLTKLRNAPNVMDSCLRRVFNGKIKPPEVFVDPENPDAKPGPEKATLKIQFKKGG